MQPPITITITITGIISPDYYYYYYSWILQSLLLLLLLLRHKCFITITVTITISNSLTTLIATCWPPVLTGQHFDCCLNAGEWRVISAQWLAGFYYLEMGHF